MMVEESWKETEYFKEEFTIPKSGEFKGMVTSKWHRNNSGWIGLECPKCGGWIQQYKGDTSSTKCECGWIKDMAGFRYRFALIN